MGKSRNLGPSGLAFTGGAYRENQMFTCHSRKQAAAPDAIFTFLLADQICLIFLWTNCTFYHPFMTRLLTKIETSGNFTHFGPFIQDFTVEIGSFNPWKSGNAVLFSTQKFIVQILGTPLRNFCVLADMT